jgi:hypothetical protein
MKPNDKLNEFLKEYSKLAVPADPDFRPSVWRRIEAEKRQRGWTKQTMTKLAFAGGLCAVTLTAAGWTGHASARAQVAADRETMANHYLASLDARAKAELHR